jgi:hypothetical protein
MDDSFAVDPFDISRDAVFPFTFEEIVRHYENFAE